MVGSVFWRWVDARPFFRRGGNLQELVIFFCPHLLSCFSQHGALLCGVGSGFYLTVGSDWNHLLDRGLEAMRWLLAESIFRRNECMVGLWEEGGR